MPDQDMRGLWVAHMVEHGWMNACAYHVDSLRRVHRRMFPRCKGVR